ncbi:MAG TPA: tripartite tricarboxylate transporter substrate binding protein [Variovorax sp.]|nr:tripartite tricarboxylate transporter substrate binding protein [Variovorax sp.]
MFPSYSRTLGALAIASLAATGAQAQNFPGKPVTLIVPFAPGASADGIARIVARELSQALGQPVVVDNKPGAGGALGLIALAKAPADGYTIGMGATGAIAINPHLPDAPPLKPERDLVAVAKVADIPLVLVAGAGAGAGASHGSLKAFLSQARATPGGLSYGTPGQYTAQHLSGELLASMAKVPMTAVAYRGSAPAVSDLLGGQVPAAVVDLTSAYPHVKAGKLAALGVTSANRSKIAPEIPTIAEEGVPGYAAPAWMGLFAPAKTPPAVTTRLSNELKTIMARPEVQAQLVGLAAEPVFMDGKAFGEFIAGESKKWAAVVAKLPSPQK